MQKDSKILDDLAKLGTSAVGGFMDIKREMESMIGAQLEKMLLKMHLVTKEEFEVVREMAVKAREENEKLRNRLDEIEQGLKQHTHK